MKIHVFEDLTSGEVYDETQTNDDIEMGDVLVISRERIVGFLCDAWPVAVTRAHGALHGKDPAWSWGAVATPARAGSRDYSDSVNAALGKARELGYEIDEGGEG